MPPILVPSSAKHIATAILLIAKSRNYLFKASNWSTGKRCSYCSRLTIKTLEQFQNVRLFTCLNNKLFSYVLEILNHDGLWENKKLLYKNQRFNWIKSIHWCRLINVGRLAGLDYLTCLTIIPKKENIVGGPG